MSSQRLCWSQSYKEVPGERSSSVSAPPELGIVQPGDLVPAASTTGVVPVCCLVPGLASIFALHLERCDPDEVAISRPFVHEPQVDFSDCLGVRPFSSAWPGFGGPTRASAVCPSRSLPGPGSVRQRDPSGSFPPGMLPCGDDGTATCGGGRLIPARSPPRKASDAPKKASATCTRHQRRRACRHREVRSCSGSFAMGELRVPRWRVMRDTCAQDKGSSSFDFWSDRCRRQSLGRPGIH